VPGAISLTYRFRQEQLGRQLFLLFIPGCPPFGHSLLPQPLQQFELAARFQHLISLLDDPGFALPFLILQITDPAAYVQPE